MPISNELSTIMERKRIELQDAVDHENEDENDDDDAVDVDVSSDKIKMSNITFSSKKVITTNKNLKIFKMTSELATIMKRRRRESTDNDELKTTNDTTNANNDTNNENDADFLISSVHSEDKVEAEDIIYSITPSTYEEKKKKTHEVLMQRRQRQCSNNNEFIHDDDFYYDDNNDTKVIFEKWTTSTDDEKEDLFAKWKATKIQHNQKNEDNNALISSSLNTNVSSCATPTESAALTASSESCDPQSIILPCSSSYSPPSSSSSSSSSDEEIETDEEEDDELEDIDVRAISSFTQQLKEQKLKLSPKQIRTKKELRSSNKKNVKDNTNNEEQQLQQKEKHSDNDDNCNLDNKAIKEEQHKCDDNHINSEIILKETSVSLNNAIKKQKEEQNNDYSSNSSSNNVNDSVDSLKDKEDHNNNDSTTTNVNIEKKCEISKSTSKKCNDDIMNDNNNIFIHNKIIKQEHQKQQSHISSSTNNNARSNASFMKDKCNSDNKMNASSEVVDQSSSSVSEAITPMLIIEQNKESKSATVCHSSSLSSPSSTSANNTNSKANNNATTANPTNATNLNNATNTTNPTAATNVNKHITNEDYNNNNDNINVNEIDSSGSVPTSIIAVEKNHAVTHLTPKKDNKSNNMNNDNLSNELTIDENLTHRYPSCNDCKEHKDDHNDSDNVNKNLSVLRVLETNISSSSTSTTKTNNTSAKTNNNIISKTNDTKKKKPRPPPPPFPPPHVNATSTTKIKSKYKKKNISATTKSTVQKIKENNRTDQKTRNQSSISLKIITKYLFLIVFISLTCSLYKMHMNLKSSIQANEYISSGEWRSSCGIFQLLNDQNCYWIQLKDDGILSYQSSFALVWQMKSNRYEECLNDNINCDNHAYMAKDGVIYINDSEAHFAMKDEESCNNDDWQPFVLPIKNDEKKKKKKSKMLEELSLMSLINF